MDDSATEAPEGNTGWTVRILDLSGGAEDNIVEDIRNFLDIAHANAFARAYVRDSIEICRSASTTPRDTLNAWFAYGENAEVLDAGEEGWKSSTELNEFVERPATPMERDWRALDPRQLIDPDELPGAGLPEDGLPEDELSEGGTDEDDV
ncbi:hypothetical protein [Acetobacter fallax]|uniref:Uncharacterized protein n=1 Tax=Acetobacter fallax TaxID=1737473 RepID=A0ABX0K757_9PROT|nr:hypothetical protein [Acetobacter fallax]NHO32227.1 hypothetical protein [Acetobacter fallax]NHO35720.1 hypothetical protein [Acetobacter fallax]